MKKQTLLFLLSLVTLFPAYAQHTTGEVAYKETVRLELKLAGDDPRLAQIQAKMPSSRENSMKLLFNESASLYQLDDSTPTPPDELLENNGEEGVVKMVFMRPQNVIYQDLRAQTRIEQRDFMGRTFLIEEEISKQSWKLSPEQKEILGYPCQKATLELDSVRTVEAWFTPQIPVSLGPDTYGGLPGLILEVNLNQGRRVITAQQVDLKSVADEDLEAPQKGKKVSREEFRKITEEKFKEMQENSGGQGTFMIKKGGG